MTNRTNQSADGGESALIADDFVTNKRNDGEVVNAGVDFGGAQIAQISLKAEVIGGGFEAWGSRNGDIITLSFVDQDGNEVFSEDFSGKGSTLTGSLDQGRVITADRGMLTYDLPAGVTGGRFIVTSDISANSEKVEFSQITAIAAPEIVATQAVDATERMMADEVVATGPNPDEVLEVEVDASDLTNAQITLDAKVTSSGNFELWGTNNGDIITLSFVDQDGNTVFTDEFTGTGKTLTSSLDGDRKITTDGGTLTYDLPEGVTGGRFVITSDISAKSESVTFSNVKISGEADDCGCGSADDAAVGDPVVVPPAVDADEVCVDFSNAATGAPLLAGTVVDASLQFEGVSFRAIRKQDINGDGVFNDGMIFDAANPTGGDDDLFQAELGNVLIISEDNDGDDPDDNAQGGQIVADFEVPSTVKEVTILDTETRDGATIDLLDADGVMIAQFDVPQIQNGGKQLVSLGNTPGVSSVVFNFKSSGAIDEFKFVPGDDGGDQGGSGDGDPDPIGSKDCIAFDVLADGTQLAAGDGEGDLVFDGVTFSAIRRQDINGDGLYNDAMIFDATNPTGGDDDLFQPMSGNVLIISEDGDEGDPDDNAQGGQIVAELDAPSTLHSVNILDTETRDGATIDVFGLNEAGETVLLQSFPVPQIVDGGIQPLDFGDIENVTRVEFNFLSSGAIDKFCFTQTPPPPPPPPPVETSISGRYFCDENGNALDDGEKGVANRTVELRQAGPDGILGNIVYVQLPSGDFVPVDDDVIVATTTTDADGNYSFDNIDPGEYAVRFIGTGFVQKDVDGNVSDDVDSDVFTFFDFLNPGAIEGITEAITVGDGDIITDIDAGTECFKLPEPGDLLGLAGRVSSTSVNFNNDGFTRYDYDETTKTGEFVMNARPLLGTTDLFESLDFGDLPRIEINATLDGNGNIIDGAGAFVVWNDAGAGAANNDRVFDGDPNSPDFDPNEFAFLTGDLIVFGSSDGVSDTDNFDAIIEITGGTLADDFSPLIGVAWSSESVTGGQDFTGSFRMDFQGEAKGDFGDVNIDCFCG